MWSVRDRHVRYCYVLLGTVESLVSSGGFDQEYPLSKSHDDGCSLCSLCFLGRIKIALT